jgi:D-aspartate ligase
VHGKRVRVTQGRPLACVVGGMDLVRPLGLAGVRSAVVVGPGNVAAHSRFTRAVIPLADPLYESDVLLDRLMAFARRQPEPPALFYGQDADLLFVSRERARLRQGFRFVVPDAALVESLVDKVKFADLARRLELPVPPSSFLTASAVAADDVGLGFPVIVKPVVRGRGNWSSIAHGAKALRADTSDELRRLWPQLAREQQEVVVQQFVPGPESRVESYHVYVEDAGDIVGEFSGRKIRTDPPAYGQTTSLEITADRDVMQLGRELVRRIGLRGVAKFDFKRDPAGRLHLLEVNPRFNLWHHPGARAGVNLPALVYRDLVGLPRPRLQAARPGVRWVHDRPDLRAARREGISRRRWIRWALSCEAKADVALDDPAPVMVWALTRIGHALGIGPRAREG